jgi:hypothetical protein
MRFHFLFIVFFSQINGTKECFCDYSEKILRCFFQELIGGIIDFVFCCRCCFKDCQPCTDCIKGVICDRCWYCPNKNNNQKQLLSIIIIRIVFIIIITK